MALSPIHKINEEWVWFCLFMTDMIGVASGLSVVRGCFQWNFSIGIMPTVRCPESRSAIVISIGAIACVLYIEVIRWWEGPL